MRAPLGIGRKFLTKPTSRVIVTVIGTSNGSSLVGHNGEYLILPGVNLISNIGFEARATHTTMPGDRRANFPTGEMMFPLKHPPCIIRHREGDDLIFDQVVLAGQRPSLYQKLRSRLSAALPAPLRNSIRSLKAGLISR